MSKNKKWKKYIAISGILFLIPGTLVVLAILTTNNFFTLPYFQMNGASELIELETSDHGMRVPEFQLINQDAESYTLDSLDNKIWLATFFSTNSDYLWSITSQLLWVNYRYRNIDNLYIVSFSLDPEHDQPEVISEYISQTAQYNNAEDRWQFLTGDKAALHSLVSDGFNIDPDSDPSMAWLVDGKGYLRGIYNLQITGEVKRAIEEMALLKKEADKNAKTD